MLTATRRFRAPLPTATAVVVAVLVAMAASLADVGISAESSANAVAARVPSSLVLPGRALATALASVAERLEEDWSGSRRVVPTAGAGLALPTVDRTAHIGLAVANRRSASRDADQRPIDARSAIHRRLLNLPPPSLA